MNVSDPIFIACIMSIFVTKKCFPLTFPTTYPRSDAHVSRSYLIKLLDVAIAVGDPVYRVSSQWR